MASTSAHFNLTKPATTDYYNIGVFNDNTDIIDTQMYNNQVSAAKIMVGATANDDGESGRVPVPHAGDQNKYLCADGTWKTVGGGGGGSSVTITPTLSSGTKIADYSIDGVSDSLYAPSGGGGSSTFTKLAEYTGAGVGYDAGDTINLSDSLTNYDVLMFSVLYNGTQAFPNAMVTVNDLKNKLTTGFYAGYIGGVGYTDVKYATDTSLTVLRTSSMYVYSVYGIKF